LAGWRGVATNLPGLASLWGPGRTTQVQRPPASPRISPAREKHLYQQRLVDRKLHSLADEAVDCLLARTVV